MTSRASGGSLWRYAPEFRLWATNNKLDVALTKNVYYCELTSNSWYVQSPECKKGRLRRGEPSCSLCRPLGEASSVQSTVMRFIVKYHAAVLLNKRLFNPVEDALEYVDKVNQTPFGANHPVQWGRVSKMPNIELQSYVQRGWMSVNKSLITENLEMFICGMVTPSLKVNPTCIDSRMTSLFSGYVEALCSQSLNVPWQCLAMLGMYLAYFRMFSIFFYFFKCYIPEYCRIFQTPNGFFCG